MSQPISDKAVEANQVIQDFKHVQDVTGNTHLIDEDTEDSKPMTITINCSPKALSRYGILGVVQIVIGIICFLSKLISNLNDCSYYDNKNVLVMVTASIYIIIGCIGLAVVSSINKYVGKADVSSLICNKLCVQVNLMKLLLVMSIISGLVCVPLQLNQSINLIKENNGYDWTRCQFGVNTFLVLMAVAELVVCIITVVTICKRHVRCGETKQSVTNGGQGIDPEYQIPYQLPCTVGHQNGAVLTESIEPPVYTEYSLGKY